MLLDIHKRKYVTEQNQIITKHNTYCRATKVKAP